MERGREMPSGSCAPAPEPAGGTIPGAAEAASEEGEAWAACGL